MLCKELKYVKFRSGNADGADYWFCKGVANIDPKRLELILPYSAHRKKYLLSENIYSLDKIDLIKEPEVVYQTKTYSMNNRLIELYVNGDRGRAGIKGSYLLRDTIKVIGTNSGLLKASFAIFYDDLNEPESGGTGHSIMICEFNIVPT